MICKNCFPITPQNEFELLQRAQQLAGQNLASLAAQLNLLVPIDLKRNKGWIGMLLELHLGARGGNKSEQDFNHLGIELKTIPVDSQGKPLETTFVCVAQMTGNNGITWKNSNVWRKLSHVLWIPIEGESMIPLPKRRVGSPLLWQPSEKEERQLSKDWEELMDMIVLGDVESINAFYGEWLQIRPKAVNRNSVTKAVGKNGKLITTLPRAFYLRRRFTQILLERHFLL